MVLGTGRLSPFTGLAPFHLGVRKKTLRTGTKAEEEGEEQRGSSVKAEKVGSKAEGLLLCGKGSYRQRKKGSKKGLYLRLSI